jgi:murein DD-endopeptidase MepM/ murein hydrolase activator NlpD
MPHRSGSHHNHSHHFARTAQTRAYAAAPSVGADYALVHAGRQLRLGPIAFWIVVGTLVIMAGWSITTATYFAFRDDVLTRLMAREAEMQFGYEDRIAELRAQIDRISSRQLLDQEQYENKLDQLLRRQAALEQRATALNALPDFAPTGAIKPPARSETPRGAPFKPSPISDSGFPALLQDRESRPSPARQAMRNGGVEAMLTRLTAALDRVETRQAAALNSIEDSYDSKARRLRGVLSEVGVNAAKLAAGAGGTGGPFVAAPPPGYAGAFERQVHRISVARAQVDRLTRTLGTIPLRKPVTGEIDLSSGYGVRIDPFIRAPAMHTGLDFRGESGEPVRVTAAGTVTAAGWSGGYGRMVEVDHGNGFATRYGHLSVIDVRVGQAIKTGNVVGRIGSTGRSTGPHLHYETRVDGEAVDPQKFLRAGARLGSVN